MVKFRFPSQLVDIPERLVNVEVRYEVVFSAGHGRSYAQVVSSVFNLPDLVRNRIENYSDVKSVKVFLPSGRMAFMAYYVKSSKNIVRR